MATEPTWEELLGSKNWDGLLNPLNLSLRKFVLRCGDLTQAVGDAFNYDEGSKYIGTSRYGKKDFFEKVMLESASDYEVKAFLYAPAKLESLQAVLKNSKSSDDSWDRDSYMIGYIAVTTDEVSQVNGRREIYIVWRGTVTSSESLNNLDIRLVSAKELLSSPNVPNMPKVAASWLKMYTSSNPDSTFTNLSARAQLRKKIEELRNQYKNEKLSIIATGYSLGSSLATLSAFDLVENGIRDIPVAVFGYATPHVGDQFFVDRVNSYPNLKVFRTVNKHDAIPFFPQTLLFWQYKAVGVELRVDNWKSPYLKIKESTIIKIDLGAHDLQALLHVVTGWDGDDKPFGCFVKRSLPLVNKNGDLLLDEYLIPVNWWVEKNRGMIRDDNGEWVLVQDVPEHEFQNVNGNQG